MKRVVIILLSGLLFSLTLSAEVTIEECVEKAFANYPIVKKYDLMAATKDIDLNEVNKSWLPRIGAYGQITGQNVVPSFPATLAGVLDRMGHDMKGIGKIQYKVGVDVAQTVWDGGASSARRKLIRAQEEVSQAGLEVELYAVRERVENLYFAILLIGEHIKQNRITYNLLLSNKDKLQSMLANGVAMQCDVDMVEAQALAVRQTIAQARTSLDGYIKMLELFIGEDLEGEDFAVPVAEIPVLSESNRPELRLFDSEESVNRASERLANVGLMPTVGLFAQAYYGYPGINYFQSMMNRDMSFNILAGVKISWNIDSFYTKKNRLQKTDVNTGNIAVDRELFQFNTRMQSTSQMEAINGLREVIKDDARIVSLRTNVRRAAESQLDNGVIDATTLLSKISDENMAALNAHLHEIQLLQEIYKLKYILDR